MKVGKYPLAISENPLNNAMSRLGAAVAVDRKGVYNKASEHLGNSGSNSGTSTIIKVWEERFFWVDNRFLFQKGLTEIVQGTMQKKFRSVF